MTATPYIVFEGINGCGKTTISTAVVAAIRNRGGAVAHLRQPGSVSQAGQLIHEVFSGRVVFEPKAMLWLFAAELADLEPRVEAMRAKGVMVVSDRHTMFSSFVYQEPIHGYDVVDTTMRAIEPAPPTHTYLIDVSAEVALERQAKRTKNRNTFYEPTEVEKIDQLAARYRKLPDWVSFWARSIKVLDGLQPVEENVARVLADLRLGE
jgi:dTMP kinase